MTAGFEKDGRAVEAVDHLEFIHPAGRVSFFSSLFSIFLLLPNFNISSLVPSSLRINNDPLDSSDSHYQL